MGGNVRERIQRIKERAPIMGAVLSAGLLLWKVIDTWSNVEFIAQKWQALDSVMAAWTSQSWEADPVIDWIEHPPPANIPFLPVVDLDPTILGLIGMAIAIAGFILRRWEGPVNAKTTRAAQG